ncbi:ALQxL family class IV lanthipeptide [Fodinicola acaciae]
MDTETPVQTAVDALQELPATESDGLWENSLCCMTFTVPGCNTSMIST